MEKNISISLEQVPLELKLILDLINKNPIQIEEKYNKERVKNMDWKLFMDLAMHHRVYPLLFSKIKHFGNVVPDTVIQSLQIFYKRNTLEMLRLTAEMNAVNKAFHENGIKLIFLKGPVLAKVLYGDLSLRTSNDLDILIPIEDLNKAESQLLKIGYVKDDYISSVLGDWKWRHHHVTYLHPEKNIKLEVHWRLNPGPGKEPSFGDLWRRKREISFASENIFYLGKEDLFLFLVSHGSRHGWSRLRWLIDIKQLLKHELNIKCSKQLFNDYGLLHLAGQALLLCSRLLETQITEEMGRLIVGKRPRRIASEALFYIERMVNLHSVPVQEEVSEYHKRHLFSLMSYRQKVLFLLSFLFPYYTDVETLPLPRSLHLLYFPLRPFLWILRKKRKHALP